MLLLFPLSTPKRSRGDGPRREWVQVDPKKETMESSVFLRPDLASYPRFVLIFTLTRTADLENVPLLSTSSLKLDQVQLHQIRLRKFSPHQVQNQTRKLTPLLHHLLPSLPSPLLPYSPSRTCARPMSSQQLLSGAHYDSTEEEMEEEILLVSFPSFLALARELLLPSAHVAFD